MSLPLSLAYGEMSLYRIYATGTTGVVAPQGFNFGLIDQVSMYGIQYAKIGQSVFFSGNDIQTTLTYENWRYTLLKESAVIATENGDDE